jgi:fructose/tagatose bisphosphate aldolase
MHSLRNVLEQAQENGVAIGHFNVADLVLLKAAFAAAQELQVPVIVGASEGEREFMGVRQIAVLVRSLRDEFDFPIFLNADHTHSLDKAIEAAKAGFDSIVFDLSALPFQENVRQTKEAVQALKKINPAILVEGEIGDIGTGSENTRQGSRLGEGPNESRGSETVRRINRNRHPRSGRWQHARHVEKHGAGRNEKAFGYREDRSNQKCNADSAYFARRIGNRR